MVGADRVTFCEAGMREEFSLLVDFQKVTHNGEMEVKVLNIALCVGWKISIDYKGIDESQQGKPSGL
jgi:hypothetical protein